MSMSVCIVSLVRNAATIRLGLNGKWEGVKEGLEWVFFSRCYKMTWDGIFFKVGTLAPIFKKGVLRASEDQPR